MQEEAKQARRQRVQAKARRAIEELAEQDLAAAASVLRIGRIQVVEDSKVDTAMLQLERSFTQERFTIMLNAEFCDRPQQELQAVLLHELLHHVMRHLQDEPPGNNRLLSNVVQDAFINRTIYNTAPQLAEFMSRYYDASEMPTLLLRPNSSPEREADKDIYSHLYAGQLTEAELYGYLKDEVQEEAVRRVKLLGGHPAEEEGQAPALEIEEAKKIIEELAEQQGRRIGKGGEAQEMLRKIEELEKARRREEVERAFKKALCDGMAEYTAGPGGQEGERRDVIMPQPPGRFDIYSTLAGVEPLLWRSPTRQGEAGCAVYLDVSGSMQRVIELVYSSCLALERMLGAEIYLFSNQIRKIDLEELRGGIVETSWGTDFSCVARHLAEQQEISKAVIFTDGYASLPPEGRELLESRGKRLIGVITPGGSQQSMDFCAELFQMPDVAEG